MLDLTAVLARQREQGLYRQRHAVEKRDGAKVIIDGELYTNFASNDYLGLADDPRIIDACKQGVDRYGVGSGASQLTSGYSVAHQALEERLADFLKRPRALLFGSGYMANLGAITALASRHSQLILDRRCHASLVDAAVLSRGTLTRYHTAEVDQLAERLRPTANHSLIVSDSVFSMDGDVAPLGKLVQLSKNTGAALLIDDAHGFGVLGDSGRGCLEHCALATDAIDVYIGTLGKACGTSGAFVCGSEDLIETLIQHARTVIYSTAPPPAIAHATLLSIDIIERDHWRREYVQSLVQRFRRGCEQLGLPLTDSSTPIQAVIVGSNESAVRASAVLRSQGFYISAIRPPTVAKGTARLRISLCAHHSENDVDRLLQALAQTPNCR